MTGAPGVRPQGPALVALEAALVGLRKRGQRTPCGAPHLAPLFTSEAADERAKAARYCTICALYAECAAAGAEGDEWGVWGGVDRSAPGRRKATA